MKTTDLKIKSTFYEDEFHNINLSFTRYQSNDAIAIIAKEDGEVYDFLTTNNPEEDADFNLKENNLVQIRSDYSHYADFLVENNFIKPQTVMMVPKTVMMVPSGFIFILFFEPTEEFSNYIKENNI